MHHSMQCGVAYAWAFLMDDLPREIERDRAREREILMSYLCYAGFFCRLNDKYENTKLSYFLSGLSSLFISHASAESN